MSVTDTTVRDDGNQNCNRAGHMRSTPCPSLFLALHKRWRVEYGGHFLDYRRMAVPYRAKDAMFSTEHYERGFERVLFSRRTIAEKCAHFKNTVYKWRQRSMYMYLVFIFLPNCKWCRDSISILWFATGTVSFGHRTQWALPAGWMMARKNGRLVTVSPEGQTVYQRKMFLRHAQY